MNKKNILFLIILSVFCALVGGIVGGGVVYFAFQEKKIPQTSGFFEKILNLPSKEESFSQNLSSGEYQPKTLQESEVIKIVKETAPSVISIVISKNVPVFEEYYEEFFGFEIPQFRQKGTEKKEVGWGTGFLVSADGLALTNKHVVSDSSASYTAITNDGKKYEIEVLARDNFNDLAIIKLKGEGFRPVKLGDSSKLMVGQTVIAIGNALGEFKNTVSVGVVSGLGRTITAGGGGEYEILENVIQTDAAINQGNSGGPLLNLDGEVIGINTAMAFGAENIGFALPINIAKEALEKFQKTGKIYYAYLGVWYWTITEQLQKERNLPSSYGAWVTSWSKDDLGRWYKRNEPAVIKGSPADRAGIKEGDIILEFDGQKITQENPLYKIIKKYNPSDEVVLKILRGQKELEIKVVLGQRE